MKKIIKSYMFKKVIPACLVLFVALIGVVKIDVINTKALSPLGNTNENYKLVSEEFGEDFSNFIKDNSYLKIYREEGKDMLVRLGSKDFKITDKSIFIKQIESIIKNITAGFNGAKQTMGKLL